MKKYLLSNLLLLGLLLLSPFAQAQKVALSELQRRAAAFMQKNGMMNGVAAQRGVKSVTDDGQKVGECYIFNAPNGKGFVILSGDERTESVLAYSHEQTISVSHLPENVKYWLECYSKEIVQLPASMRAHKQQVKSQVKYPVRQVVAPLCQTTWNQGAPYNNLTPTYYSGREGADVHCATGCVATAMAQVMKVHAHPSQTTKEIPSYTNFSALPQSDGTVSKPTVDAVPAHSSIDWDLMDNHYTDNTTAEQDQAVAELMQYCGASVEMNYGPESGSFITMVATALRNYFDYSQRTRVLDRWDYSRQEWEDIIYAQLLEGNPVLYGGVAMDVTMNAPGGHAFVCDGFDGTAYFHINWGWGGMANGYFRLSVLNPFTTSGIGSATSPDGYNLEQEIVVDARPAQVGERPLIGNLAIEVAIVNKSNIQVKFSLKNGKRMHDIDVGLGLLKDDGRIEYVKKIAEIDEVNAGFIYTSNPMTWIDDVCDGRPAGTYKVVVVYRSRRQHEWKNGLPGKDYIKVEKKASGSKEVEYVKPGESDLSLRSLRVVSETNGVLTLRAEIENTGEEYNGPIYVFESINSLVIGQKTFYKGVELLAGRVASVDFYIKKPGAGHYYIHLTTDEDGMNEIGMEELDIAAEVRWTHNSSGVNVKQGIPTEVVGLHLQGTMVFENTNDFGVDLPVTFYAGTGGTAQFVGTQYVKIAGKSEETMHFDLGERAADNWLVVALLGSDNRRYDYDVWLQAPKLIYWTYEGERKGWKSDKVPSRACAVDLRGNDDLSAIVPNEHANTLYYIKSGVAVPKAFEGKNVVVDGEAEQIRWVDGQSICVPEPFNAKEIVYTKSFTEKVDGMKGWQTMALPFEPTEVETASGQTVGVNEAESSKSLYTREWKGFADATTVVYGVPAAWSVNRPYLVGVSARLVGKTLQLKAHDAAVSSTWMRGASAADYVMHITYGGMRHSPAQAYQYDGAKQVFVSTDEGELKAFSTYLLPIGEMLSAPSEINVEIEDLQLTAIEDVAAAAGEKVVYDLNGRRWDALQKGVVIVNGKKMMGHK